MPDCSVRPYKIEVPERALEELRSKLSQANWPEKEPVDDWSQGVPLSYMQEICTYWQQAYDWRKCEARLNALGSFVTTIEGLDIHFLHCRSPHAAARPLVMTHGWPGSVVEFFDIIPILTDPIAYGGNAEDAFHLVLPTMPGYGFSDKPAQTGWGAEKIADSWAELMARLGYESYFAQGGDWGSMVSTELGKRHSKHCKAVHINLVVATPDAQILEHPTKKEAASLLAASRHQDQGTGYAKQQTTRPQTLGYGLVDSPIAQAAWILEKFYEWSDCEGHPENVFKRDDLLDNIMLYWLTGSGASSARLYWESYATIDMTPHHTPTGCTVFAKEIVMPSRRWAETRYKNIIHWSEMEEGGHFAAMEKPQLLAQEIWSSFSNLAG